MNDDGCHIALRCRTVALVALIATVCTAAQAEKPMTESKVENTAAVRQFSSWRPEQ
jgi:hypothetical protein